MPLTHIDLFPEYKKTFTKLNSVLRNFPTKKFENIKNDNAKLKSTLNQFSPPKPFNVFKRYIEQSLNIKINLDFAKSIDLMFEQDDKVLKDFNQPNFSYKNINLDLLLKASLITANEIGIFDKPLTIQNSFTALEELPSNTGASYPYFGKKDNPETISKVLDYVKKYFEMPSINKLLNQYITFYHRYKVKLTEDFSSSKLTTRLVWGFPFSITLIEKMLFGNLLNHHLDLSKRDWYTYDAIGKTKLQISNNIIKKFRTFGHDIYCLDYSKYDSSIPSYFFSLFYSLMYLVLEHTGDFVYYKQMMIYQNYSPYVNRENLTKLKAKGMPSGSYLTTYFNSYVNRTILNYAFLEKTHGKYSAGVYACVLGDDSIVSSKFFTLKYLKGVFDRFGIILNEAKSRTVTASGTIEFLGYFWDENNEPTQTLKWFIEHICNPGRFFSNVDIPIAVLQTYRAISICSGVKDGIKIFDELMGDNDIIWNRLKEKYLNGEKVYIRFISRFAKILFLPIPLDKIIEYGWKMF